MKLDQTKAFKPASSAESKGMGFVNRVSEWSAQHPIFAIMLVSLLAVVINCYPVVFCGKSFVSPTSTGGALVYTWWPPAPGMDKWPEPTPDMLHSVHGSDTEAMMYWGVPLGFIEARSLWEHGELPLWNRYGHAGATLIGQAVSMLGDPLQLIVILGRGSAWSWDVKFLAAKFLFCFGFGLLISRLLKSQPLSLIFAALAAYCGACFFINSHPAFFVLTYAPWILLAAIEWLDLQSVLSLRWGLIWLLANFACFNAGHVELAVVLIAGLNLAAFAYVLTFCLSLNMAAKLLGRLAVGTLLFLGLTAPMWISFLGALGDAFTTHAAVKVVQISPMLLPGVFDDLFYLLLRSNDSFSALAPGSSLLVLAGCSFSVLRWRSLKEHSFFWVNMGAIVLWGGCIFGWVPASLLARIPLLNRVGHNGVDFSYLLIIHLTIQCAYGFMTLTKVNKLKEAGGSFLCLGGIFAGMFILYLSGYWHQPIPWRYFLSAMAGAAGAPLLFVILKIRRQQTLVLGWVGIVVLGFIPNQRFGLYNSGNDALLMLPGPRAVLNSPSQAIDKLKTDPATPFRVVGLNSFMGDYSAVYELEDIRSCAPLSNLEFMNLALHFPGMELTNFWKLNVVDPVLAQPLLNLLNVKYLLAPPNVATIERMAFRVTDRSDFGVLENLQVWPRAFFANQVVPLATTAEFSEYLFDNGQQPFISLTREEIAKQPGLQKLETVDQTTVDPATNYRLLPNSTAFDVHAPSAGVVCLTEGQAKDFTVKANDEPKEVLTVNRAFKGVYLDKPGDYHIEFVYRPRHWRLACSLFWISAGGVFALATISVFRTRLERKTSKA